ncbi:MAG: Sua5 family C-terminal domain-containing protein, partial [Pseudomonadota bacterium]|nr:Sua5 family C-terminal domain-containing protein [Pseudomonadota bacterium]
MTGLAGRIDAVLDGGPCSVGVESTIVGFDGDRAVILREGGVPAEALAEVLGHDPDRRKEAGAITAPGQLASHYAPGGAVRINATKAQPDEVFVGFGPMECDLNLSETGDLAEAAANLFRHFHQLDAEGAARIAVAPVPETGLGRAINDRLRRAAAPRDS